MSEELKRLLSMRLLCVSCPIPFRLRIVQPIVPTLQLLQSPLVRNKAFWLLSITVVQKSDFHSQLGDITGSF